MECLVGSWGLPFDIDETDNIYKFSIEIAAKDKDVNKVVRLLSEYIHYVYVCGYKDICVIPFKHLDYIVGDYLTYKIFAERDFSLKIHTGTLDKEDWETEYICIQEKDRKN